MSARREREHRGQRRHPWRENIEALTVAIVVAVFLKYFVVEAYKIPTGSMQPTLMGQAFPEGGGVFDRILVDKLSYHFRAPRRFEVVVFRYPLDRSKFFVKRLWGLPGEQLRIRDGDVWVRGGPDEPWHIPRRPAGVQRSTWMPLDRGAEDAQPSWQVERGGGDWRVGDRELRARGEGLARFSGHGRGAVVDPRPGAIVDRYLDGYPEPVRERMPSARESGVHVVGDLRVEGRVRALAGCRSVRLHLEEGGMGYDFLLPGPAAEDGASPSIHWSASAAGAEPRPYEASGEPWRLPAGRWVRFRAQNLDDLLELEVDGEAVATLEVVPVRGSTSGVSVGVQGEGADLDDLQVYRDIFYTESRVGGSSWSIPADHYFMLGDNTQDSSDSREWTLVDVRWRDEGGAEHSALANFRPTRAADANPVTWNSADGQRTRVRDEWGELHDFPAEAETGSPNARRRVPRATVPRELIGGRAVAVFWPVAPRLRLWRPGWVR